MKRLIFSIAVAVVLWFVMFSPCLTLELNFWWEMTASASILTLLAAPFLWAHRERAAWGRELLFGLLIALALWGVFWVGDFLSSLLFSFARPQVDSIYGMKDGMPGWIVGLLLLLIIGPAEELFWRGYVQRSLSMRWDANRALVVTTLIYTLIHVPSMNFMLVMAAGVCGICWGGLYRLFPKHLPAIVISHAVWDAAVFVWFPI
ncbi:MAG: CPBP family intramembrane metalloprotease [Bacteroidaceae bacterium]|nr:CPBP family intramembrane metalloprotease [Bacteroidaceae bacterium]